MLCSVVGIFVLLMCLRSMIVLSVRSSNTDGDENDDDGQHKKDEDVGGADLAGVHEAAENGDDGSADGDTDSVVVVGVGVGVGVTAGVGGVG